ncbi:hypothetical protein Acr_20g0007130 [Actinidia rufa]|uniref:Uncharacterized protein n=1 Tax=Actinidia rufa TaxID=165716 RepID=A0A7J0GDS4_9ERIC|nr:hypothetical protein Acr_20g0007130 [Actinidia rufa]
MYCGGVSVVKDGEPSKINIYGGCTMVGGVQFGTCLDASYHVIGRTARGQDAVTVVSVSRRLTQPCSFKARLVASLSCSRRLDSSVGAVKGNLAVQITLCPLMCLGIATDRCISTELRRSDPAELGIERQPRSGACPSSARAGAWNFICLQLPLSSHELDDCNILGVEKLGQWSSSMPVGSLLTILGCHFSVIRLPCVNTWLARSKKLEFVFMLIWLGATCMMFLSLILSYLASTLHVGVWLGFCRLKPFCSRNGFEARVHNDVAMNKFVSDYSIPNDVLIERPGSNQDANVVKENGNTSWSALDRACGGHTDAKGRVVIQCLRPVACVQRRGSWGTENFELGMIAFIPSPELRRLREEAKSQSTGSSGGSSYPSSLDLSDSEKEVKVGEEVNQGEVPVPVLAVVPIPAAPAAVASILLLSSSSEAVDDLGFPLILLAVGRQAELAILPAPHKMKGEGTRCGSFHKTTAVEKSSLSGHLIPQGREGCCQSLGHAVRAARRRPWRDCLPPPSHHPWPIGAPARPVEGHRAKRKPFEVKSTLIGVESSLVRSVSKQISHSHSPRRRLTIGSAFPTRSGRVSDEIGASFRQASEKEAPIRGSQGDSPPLCKIPATNVVRGARTRRLDVGKAHTSCASRASCDSQICSSRIQMIVVAELIVVAVTQRAFRGSWQTDIASSSIPLSSRMPKRKTTLWKVLGTPTEHPAWTTSAPEVALPSSHEPYSPMILSGFNMEDYMNQTTEEGAEGEVEMGDVGA